MSDLSNTFIRKSDYSWEQGWITWANERKPDENSSSDRRGLTSAPTGEGAPDTEERPGGIVDDPSDSGVGVGGEVGGGADPDSGPLVQRYGAREGDYPFSEEFAATQAIENALERLRRAVASPSGDVFHEFRHPVGDAGDGLRIGRQPPRQEPPILSEWPVPTSGTLLARTFRKGRLGRGRHLRPRGKHRRG